MDTTSKIAAFQYILYKLNEWYKDNNGEKENDLSILKAMKLLFFVSGVDVGKNLLGTFDNFQAWQYGHVEADVYKEYSKVDGNLSCLKIDRNKTIFEEKIDKNSILGDSGIRENIDFCIDKLKSINKNFINYDAFRLVDLSHSYLSWDTYYNKWKEPYTKMDDNIILYEPKYY